MAKKRPILVTVICIFGFITVSIWLLSTLFILLIPSLFQEFSGLYELSFWHHIFSIILTTLILISFILIWKMKKIGFNAYTILLAIGYIYSFSVGLVNYIGMLLSLVLLGLLFIKYKEME